MIRPGTPSYARRGEQTCIPCQAFARAPEVLEKAAMRLAEVAPTWQSLVAEATSPTLPPPPPADLLPNSLNPGPEALQSLGLPQAECEGKSEDKQPRALPASTEEAARPSCARPCNCGLRGLRLLRVVAFLVSGACGAAGCVGS